MSRTEPTADVSFAEIFARSKLGIAMAAMIRMIATTIKSSISENLYVCAFPIPISFQYNSQFGHSMDVLSRV